MDDDRRKEIALFRYSLIREAADAALSSRERGALVRALAAREHLGLSGRRVRVSRQSLDRWIRAWRSGGFEALMPSPRKTEPRTPAQMLELAEALKKEVPARSAAQVARIIRAREGTSPSERTLQRHFARMELNRSPQSPRAYGRFEAEQRNELWTGDALHGPVIGGAKTYLFAFIDDHSRLLPGYRWGRHEDSLRLEAALRAGLASRGVPSTIYVDNGSPFVSSHLLRTCAVLGVRLTHSVPGRPEGRGKIERAFRSVRSEFLVEVASRELADVHELNRLFSAWVEVVYHQRVHTETGQTPLARFLSPGPPALPGPNELREAFLWSEHRVVTKVGTVSLYGNSYEVDAALVGRRVELVFDPFDLSEIEVRYQGRAMGSASPLRIGRHTHPEVRTQGGAPPAPRTGIDYLGLIEAQFLEQTRRRIAYGQLPLAGDEEQKEETE